MIRKANENDIDAIECIYNKIHDLEESGASTIGWRRGWYPTRDTAMTALKHDELFVYDDSGVLAAGIINRHQLDCYRQAHWHVSANDEEVMVLHTLVVDPDHSGQGIGTKMVKFYEQYARDNGCKALRIDTQAKNTTAKKMYARLGYTEVETIVCDFQPGLDAVNLVLLEKENIDYYSS